MLITSNLVFSEWERIFKDPMATAAAIDRLVHHAVILEFNVPSYRTRKPRRPDISENTDSAAAELA
jgi:DNA replication protein DnaC